MSENEQENEKRETVADVLAIVRRAAQYYDGEAEKSEGLLREIFKLSADNYREIADRIEAAWKRDRTEIEANALNVGAVVATTEKSSAVGNAAAMRDALREAIGETCAGCKRDCDDCMNLKSGWMKKAKAALSAPLRQCDVGTAEERKGEGDGK